MYDPFLGSGTSIIAAESIGRICYGLEINPAYCDSAVRRWQEHAGKQAQHAETGRTFDEVAAGTEGIDGTEQPRSAG